MQRGKLIKMTEYADFVKKAQKEAEKEEFADHWLCGSEYFSCGESNDKYYNHAYAIAVAIIGRIYAVHKGNNSDYHNGIAYIAERLGISKRKVKCLRKKHKAYRSYIFKTPYIISDIIEKIISLLKDQETHVLVQKFLNTYNEALYRDLLIETQYYAIKNSATRTGRAEILKVEGLLDNMIDKIGGK